MRWGVENVIESDVCLLPMISDLSSRYMRLYHHYKNGLLPISGGLLDQSSMYLEAMEIIDTRLINDNNR